MTAARRRCRDYVRGLHLPPVRSIRDLRPDIERIAGTPIHLLPVDLGRSVPCGMYVATKEAAYVAYDTRTSLSHQDHIIGHEFAHILRGHRSNNQDRTSDVGRLLNVLDPSLITLVLDRLGRTDYTHQDEAEAELIATYLQAHVLAQPSGQPSHQAPEADRITRTLLRSR
ncbi:regulator component [Streptomyces sp. NPDC003860]